MRVFVCEKLHCCTDDGCDKLPHRHHQHHQFFHTTGICKFFFEPVAAFYFVIRSKSRFVFNPACPCGVAWRVNACSNRLDLSLPGFYHWILPDSHRTNNIIIIIMHDDINKSIFRDDELGETAIVVACTGDGKREKKKSVYVWIGEMKTHSEWIVCGQVDNRRRKKRGFVEYEWWWKNNKSQDERDKQTEETEETKQNRTCKPVTQRYF